jgi:hypothetical protein
VRVVAAAADFGRIRARASIIAMLGNRPAGQCARSRSDCSVSGRRRAQRDADNYTNDELRHVPHSNLDKWHYRTSREFLVGSNARVARFWLAAFGATKHRSCRLSMSVGDQPAGKSKPSILGEKHRATKKAGFPAPFERIVISVVVLISISTPANGSVNPLFFSSGDSAGAIAVQLSAIRSLSLRCCSAAICISSRAASPHFTRMPVSYS